MEQELLQLENKVRELEMWKESRIKQRFTFPIDYNSRNIIDRKNIIATGNTYPTQGISLTDLLGFGLVYTINGINKPSYSKVLVCTVPLYRFDANATTDIIDYVRGSFYVRDNDVIALTTSGSLPAGLDAITQYYVINATINTFKVSLTQGGAAINITSVGSGNHYFGKLT